MYLFATVIILFLLQVTFGHTLYRIKVFFSPSLTLKLTALFIFTYTLYRLDKHFFGVDFIMNLFLTKYPGPTLADIDEGKESGL